MSAPIGRRDRSTGFFTRAGIASVVVLALLATGCSSEPDGGVTIYGDGDIGCPDHVADDQSLPVGEVVYQPGDSEIRVDVTLTAAAPNVSYNVEVWTDTCEQISSSGDNDGIRRIETDQNGAGELEFLLTGLEAGTYRLNVNLCCGDAEDGGVEDPRHREMGTAQFTEVIVP